MRLPRQLRAALGIATPAEAPRLDPVAFEDAVGRQRGAVVAALQLVDEATLERMAIDAWSHTLPAGHEHEAPQLWPRLPAEAQRPWRRIAWSLARHLGHRAPFPP